MKKPLVLTVAALGLALLLGLGLVFLRAYRGGITVHLGEGARPDLPPPPSPDSVLPGAGSGAITNEQLQAQLQQQTQQMGIRRIAPQGERDEDGPESPRSFLGPRLGAPGTRAQAETAIREMSRLRRSVDTGKNPAVPLSGRTAPLLSEPDSGGRALEGAPGPEGATSPAGASPQSSGPGAWFGQYAAVPEGTLTVADAGAWARLWAALSREPAPEVDFSRQQVVGVFLGPQPSGGFRVEIDPSVAALPTAVLVRYRVLAPPVGRTPPEGATAPFALRAIAKTDLPVRFERTR